ncbi:uncharacterized protein N7446_010661 [Penicillium canescens]|uniref:Uncharacterized protein n=1 Tax=Penicillium canescens TaxID=5083 RepID=A0AAD6IC93_PENCN|nr:uncharacterized protein N7446_010661 [Penicillium canescens]KAJ6041451.1 hypothetical protein N7460_006841 [Penicillium canescens]KAJ6050552.1 hypothetical protein N7446_010661 [Penicillium canescens]
MFFNCGKYFRDQIFDDASQNNISGLLSQRKHVYEIPRKKMVIYGRRSFSVSWFTKVVKNYVQIPSRLRQDPDPHQLHDVYVVLRPAKLSRAFASNGPACDFSLYSDGHFYYAGKGDKLYIITIRDDDYSGLNQLNLVSNTSPAPPSLAYHLGKTIYSQEQIYDVALYVVDQLNQYHLSTTDYRQFVFELATRIICARRNSTVFIGNWMQIVAQDQLLRATGPDCIAPSGFYTGSRLAGPNERIDTWCARYSLKRNVEINADRLAACWYEGMQGISSFNISWCHCFPRFWILEKQGETPKNVSNPLAASQNAKSIRLPSSKIYQRLRLAVIFALREGAQIPDCLETIHCFSSLYYIRTKVSMTEKEFLNQMSFIYSLDAAKVVFQNGFEDDLGSYLRTPSDLEPSKYARSPSKLISRTAEDGKSIGIWDTLRPYEVQVAGYQKGYGYQILVDKALAFPKEPKPHTRGVIM